MTRALLQASPAPGAPADFMLVPSDMPVARCGVNGTVNGVTVVATACAEALAGNSSDSSASSSSSNSVVARSPGARGG